MNKSGVTKKGEEHSGMVPVGGNWKNKNSRENVKDCAKISGKNKNWEF